jgi:hypothetical protein
MGRENKKLAQGTKKFLFFYHFLFFLSLYISIFYLEFKFESGFMINIHIYQHIKTLVCKIKFYVIYFPSHLFTRMLFKYTHTKTCALRSIVLVYIKKRILNQKSRNI